MKRLTQIWNKMDFTTRLGIGVFAFYMVLYVVLDILEELLGVAM